MPDPLLDGAGSRTFPADLLGKHRPSGLLLSLWGCAPWVALLLQMLYAASLGKSASPKLSSLALVPKEALGVVRLCGRAGVVVLTP